MSILQVYIFAGSLGCYVSALEFVGGNPVISGKPSKQGSLVSFCALCHRVGYRDVQLEGCIQSGYRLDTQIIHGPIPEQGTVQGRSEAKKNHKNQSMAVKFPELYKTPK